MLASLVKEQSGELVGQKEPGADERELWVIMLEAEGLREGGREGRREGGGEGGREGRREGGREGEQGRTTVCSAEVAS